MKRVPTYRRLWLIAMPALLLLVACNNDTGTSEALSHLSRSETYAEQGQYRSAVLELHNAIQAEPAAIDLRVRLAQLYINMGNPKAAENLLTPLLAEHPSPVALTLARAYSAQGKHVSAGKTLANLNPESTHDQAEMALIQAESLRQSGRTDDALKRFSSLAENQPGNPAATRGLIESLLDQGKATSAIRVAEAWTNEHGPDPDILYLKGLAYYRLNTLEPAAAALTEAVAAVPSSDVFLPVRRNIVSLLARTLTEQGKITEAQIYHRILAENTNSEAQEQAQAAIAAIKEDRLDDAKHILEDVLTLNPENQAIALLLGAVAYEQGNLSESATLFRNNVDPETSPPTFIRAAAIAQIDMGQREEALEILSRAVEARPDDPELLGIHGIIALSFPEHEQAGRESLAKAIQGDPDNIGLRLILARHLIAQGIPDEALNQLRGAYTTDPAHWVSTGLYLSLLIEGQHEEEVAEIRESLRNGYPATPESRLLIAIADAGLGHTEKAIAQLKALSNDYPDSPQPNLVLSKLYRESGNQALAIDALVRSAISSPESPVPLRQASQLYAEENDVDDTIRWLESVGKEHPVIAANAQALAALWELGQGRLAAARARLSSDRSMSSALREVHAELLIAEAEQAMDAGAFQVAREKTAEAIAMQPNNLRFALAQSNIPLREGHPEVALSILLELEKTFGAETRILSKKATVLLLQGETESAIELYELILQRAPDHLSALNNLAWLLKETAPRRALELATRASRLAPENPAILDTYGWILYLVGEAEEARKVTEKAYALAPENEEIAKHLKTIKQSL